jgi:hypothetical protein
MRRVILATAALCLVASAPAAAAPHKPPDAELFAANTTEIITDAADPRLDDKLVTFRRQVKRIITHRGGRPRGAQLVDGVFFSSILGTTTFQRSGDFDVDRVSRKELHAIADAIRRRYHQQSVLTFDYAERAKDPRDAVEVEVPGLDAKRLGEGFVADAEARERLQGGSVTLDGRLILIAARSDLDLVERFVTEIGGDFGAAKIRRGSREFVS